MSTEPYGDATIKRLDDGTRIVEHADDRIGVSMELLASGMRDFTAHVLNLDTAREYRYVAVGIAMNGSVVVFERVSL